MTKFFTIGKRRMLGMLLGNLLLGFGVTLFKLSGMGNDPFNGMAMAVSALSPLSYSNFLVLMNTCIFLLEWLLGRKYIGIGTFVNWVLVGYVVEFLLWISGRIISPPASIPEQLFYVIVGIIIVSLGLSLYQTSDAGIAPFDSMPLILHNHIPALPYFWCRMIFDASCVVICLLAGGLIGLGTFLCAFGLGPVVHFFNNRVSQKIIYPGHAVRE